MVRCAISFLNKYGGIKDCISIETIWFHLYVETKKKNKIKKKKTQISKIRWWFPGGRIRKEENVKENKRCKLSVIK